MTTIFKAFITIFCFLGSIQNAQASEAAWFTILKPNGVPFQNTAIYIFDGDIESKSSIKDRYPYTSQEKKPFFLGAAITDENGNFGIKVQNYKQHQFVLRAGSIYFPTTIEKSNDLAHTPSEDHLRYLELEDKNLRVKVNHIYNWRMQSVITIPLNSLPLAEQPAERILLKTHYLQKLAPFTPPLEQEKIGALFQPFKTLTYNHHLLDDAHRAITGNQLTLRAYAATYLGKYGTYESVPYLIDALSDQSAHVGANYKDAGLATTRHRAALALKELVGEDFGFTWNTSIEKRKDSINKWKDWLNERNIMIDLIKQHLAENTMEQYDIYRIHLNKNKTHWDASLTKDPPSIGTPALTLNRTTHKITMIKGR